MSFEMLYLIFNQISKLNTHHYRFIAVLFHHDMSAKPEAEDEPKLSTACRISCAMCKVDELRPGRRFTFHAQFHGVS